jgi:alkylation response protein AidB-like acyl-CoA dehydrogenase
LYAEICRLSINPPAAHRIASEAEALRVAEHIATILLEQDAAERDRSGRSRQISSILFSNSGLWGITVPRQWGGAEVSYATLAQVIAIISAADPSLGKSRKTTTACWRIFVCRAARSNRPFLWPGAAGASFRQRALGNRRQECARYSATLRRYGDGHVINGRKGYCTGSLYAHWIAFWRWTPTIAPAGLRPARHAGLTVVDDWDCIGQRTTASGTVLAEICTVAAFNLFPTYPTKPDPGRPLRPVDHGRHRCRHCPRCPARHHRLRAPVRPVDRRRCKASEDPLTIIQVGGLDIRLEAAEALLERAGRALDAARPAPDEDSGPGVPGRGPAKVLTTEIAIEASNKLFELGGTRSTLKKHNFDRHWRNARVHTLHDPVRWKYHVVGNWLLNGVKPPRHDWS